MRVKSLLRIGVDGRLSVFGPCPFMSGQSMSLMEFDGDGDGATCLP